MKCVFLYNYVSNERTQMPDKNGNFKYKSYFKFDLLIKSKSKKGCEEGEFEILTSNSLSRIKNVTVSDANLHPSWTNNAARINFDFFKNNQVRHVDLFISNCYSGDSLTLRSISDGIEFRRDKSLAVKKNPASGKKRSHKKTFWLVWFPILLTIISMGSLPWWWGYVMPSRGINKKSIIQDSTKHKLNSKPDSAKKTVNRPE